MKNPNTCRLIMHVIVFIGIVVSGISGLISDVEPILPMFIIGAIISFGGIIWGIIKVRCPSKSKLNLRGLGTDYCPHCGEKIEFNLTLKLSST
jgi:hypothetical protein